MPDVILLSSVFGQVKIAEPMGASILAARLRADGWDVEIVEPSVHGWTVPETVDQIARRKAGIVGISMLRDKNVHNVLKFATALRERCPDRFIVMGGHGPSISLADIPNGTVVADYLTAPDPWSLLNEECASSSLIPVEQLFTGPVVDPSLTGRGKGSADIPDRLRRRTTYYDVTPEYLAICDQIDAVLIGESDTNFPDLVARVVAGTDWSDIPGLVRIEAGVFYKNPPPAKMIDLDTVPFMARDVLEAYQEVYQRTVPASILASRGCFYRCTFCSVVKYERLQQGINHRQRSNENIIDEIVWLHDRYGVTTFNFEDDNFVVKNKAGFDKIHDLCDRIMRLPFKISFAFFCRADVVRDDLFRHLKEAGLSGLYFGIESVYQGDLEFFHKGLSVDQMFHALDTLEAVGFSVRVGADLRVMLGYITWHPLTSFASLRASSAFIRRYEAPPKLLRRKLRVYAGTEVIEDVARMGLLDGDHRDGWRFQNADIQGLDEVVDTLSTTVNKRRDMLRTLEKAGRSHGYNLNISEFTLHRRYLDRFLCDQFDRFVDAAESGGVVSPAMDAARAQANTELDGYFARESLLEKIAEGYATCGFDISATDLFRK